MQFNTGGGPRCAVRRMGVHAGEDPGVPSGS